PRTPYTPWEMDSTEASWGGTAPNPRSWKRQSDEPRLPHLAPRLPPDQLHPDRHAAALGLGDPVLPAPPVVAQGLCAGDGVAEVHQARAAQGGGGLHLPHGLEVNVAAPRSEERRVGKEWRARRTRRTQEQDS